jgi:hypothetical protein
LNSKPERIRGEAADPPHAFVNPITESIIEGFLTDPMETSAQNKAAVYPNA